MSYTLTIPGRPIPKGRPRLVDGRVFTPRSTRDFESRIAWSCLADRVRFGDEPVSVVIELHGRTKLRGDIDNYEKAVLDGLVKGGKIDDDRYVVHTETTVVDGAIEDKTIVRIAARAAA